MLIASHNSPGSYHRQPGDLLYCPRFTQELQVVFPKTFPGEWSPWKGYDDGTSI
jgi:hypothetical protein